MADRERLLVIGNGMAAMRLLEELDARGCVGGGDGMNPQPAGSSPLLWGEGTGGDRPSRNLFDITVIGAEPRGAYNRVLLSPLLAGEMAWEDVRLKPAEWYAGRGIRLVLGDAAVAL